MTGKGIGVLNLDIGGDVGGRSVLWVAEGGNKGPRELRVGIRGSSYRSPRKRRVSSLRRLRVWGLRGSRKKEGLRGVRLRGYRSKGAAVKRLAEREISGSPEWEDPRRQSGRVRRDSD